MILLDKPPGPTSHDMVDEIRRISGAYRVGHGGTLDPSASGLLVILVGSSTRLLPFLPSDPKVYEGTVVLGLSTDTLDLMGRVVSRAPFRGGVEEVREALESLVGELEQVPPMYSAAKHRGKPLYVYARRGQEVPRKARKIRVYRAEMTAFRRRREEAEVDFRIWCSPGTYVRELAQRLGEKLGCGGALSRLRRISSGPFRVEEAVTPEELRHRWKGGESPLLPPLEALRGLPIVEVREEWARMARNGAPLAPHMLISEWRIGSPGDLVAVTQGGNLVGVFEVTGETPHLKARRIIL